MWLYQTKVLNFLLLKSDMVVRFVVDDNNNTVRFATQIALYFIGTRKVVVGSRYVWTNQTWIHKIRRGTKKDLQWKRQQEIT